MMKTPAELEYIEADMLSWEYGGSFLEAELIPY